MTREELMDHPISNRLWEEIYKKLDELQFPKRQGPQDVSHFAYARKQWARLWIYFIRRMMRRNPPDLNTWLWVLLPAQRCQTMLDTEALRPLFDVARADASNVHLRTQDTHNLSARVPTARHASELGLDMNLSFGDPGATEARDGDELSLMDQADLARAEEAKLRIEMVKILEQMGNNPEQIKELEAEAKEVLEREIKIAKERSQRVSFGQTDVKSPTGSPDYSLDQNG